MVSVAAVFCLKRGDDLSGKILELSGLLMVVTHMQRLYRMGRVMIVGEKQKHF